MVEGFSEDRGATLGVILSELRDMRREQAAMRAEIAALKVMDGQHRQNIERFWAQNWGPLVSQLEGINQRLTALERAQNDDHDKLAQRVIDLEKTQAVAEAIAAEAKRSGLVAGSGAGALAAGAIEGVRYLWEIFR